MTIDSAWLSIDCQCEFPRATCPTIWSSEPTSRIRTGTWDATSPAASECETTAAKSNCCMKARMTFRSSTKKGVGIYTVPRMGGGVYLTIGRLAYLGRPCERCSITPNPASRKESLTHAVAQCLPTAGPLLPLAQWWAHLV